MNNVNNELVQRLGSSRKSLKFMRDYIGLAMLVFEGKDEPDPEALANLRGLLFQGGALKNFDEQLKSTIKALEDAQIKLLGD